MVHCAALGNVLIVDYTLSIKENCQHHLHFRMNFASFLFGLGYSTHSLEQLNICFDVITIISRFISCYDPRQRSFIFFWTLKQFPTSLDMRGCLVVYHQPRKIFPNNQVHLQFFSSNLVTWFNWYPTFISKLSDGNT